MSGNFISEKSGPLYKIPEAHLHLLAHFVSPVYVAFHCSSSSRGNFYNDVLLPRGDIFLNKKIFK